MAIIVVFTRRRYMITLPSLKLIRSACDAAETIVFKSEPIIVLKCAQMAPFNARLQYKQTSLPPEPTVSTIQGRPPQCNIEQVHVANSALQRGFHPADPYSSPAQVWVEFKMCQFHCRLNII